MTTQMISTEQECLISVHPIFYLQKLAIFILCFALIFGKKIWALFVGWSIRLHLTTLIKNNTFVPEQLNLVLLFYLTSGIKQGKPFSLIPQLKHLHSYSKWFNIHSNDPFLLFSCRAAKSLVWHRFDFFNFFIVYCQTSLFRLTTSPPDQCA